MKSLRVMVAVFFLMVLSAPGAFAQKADKIAYVDLSRLFDEYSKTKEYDKVLEAKNGDYEKQRNEKIEKLRDAQGKLAVLKEDEKAKLNGDIEKMRTDLVEFDRQQKTDLTKDRNEKIREILLEIEKIVSDYAKKNSFTLILNDRVLIYGDKSYDLTEQILKVLNDNKPADAPKAKN